MNPILFAAPSSMCLPSAQSRAVCPGRVVIIAVAALTLVLAGCGEKSKDKAASQTAVKVNKEEITVHQINYVLQQQRNVKPEQADAASAQILERLIDQELAVQKSQELKLDREPRVVQQIEAAKREILARSYSEKLGETAAKPTSEEIKKYYDDKPALFKERRIYSLQEISIEATPAQVPELRAKLEGSKNMAEFVEHLKTNNFRFSGNQAVRAAEQLPLESLGTFAKMKDGQAIINPSATGAQVLVLVGSRSEPVDEARAKPAIEQFLLNDAKRKLVMAELKAMRAAAQIEYVGKFAEGAASAAAAPAAKPAPAPSPSASSAGGMTAEDISKGMGLKK